MKKSGGLLTSFLGLVAASFCVVVLLTHFGRMPVLPGLSWASPSASVSQSQPPADVSKPAPAGVPSAPSSPSSTPAPDASAAAPSALAGAQSAVTSLKTGVLSRLPFDAQSAFGLWQHDPQMCGAGTTRDLVLKQSLSNVVLTSDCHVQSGVFHDPESGKSVDYTRGAASSMAVMVMPVVSLKEAWMEGAANWSGAQRAQYLSDASAMTAMSGRTALARGSGFDPASGSVWSPTDKTWGCAYMAQRVRVQSKYGLIPTGAVKQSEQAYLAGCR